MSHSRLLHSPSLVLAVAALLTGCSRTGLEIDDGLTLPIQDAAVADDQADDQLNDQADDPTHDQAHDQADVYVAEEATPMVHVVDASPPQDPCANKPAIPCPGGGFQYCVAGQYSACPTRCGLCVPGSQQVCFLSYCRSWGIQTCAADGLSFGYCQEQAPPSACEAVADEHHASAALEQCCLDNGYCCQDQFDLNGNGKTGEPIGQCSGVTCSP